MKQIRMERWLGVLFVLAVLTTSGWAQGSPRLQWSVVEKDLSNGNTWTSVWTVGDDGKSFTADWKAQHSGERGLARDMARLVAIDGGQIRIERPGLGT